MKKLFRFGISIDKDLITKFDKLIRERNYTNRSEAIRDLIRQELVKKHWQAGKQIAGAITIVYNHNKRELVDKITNIQHDFQKIIISTQHIHLDHDNCMEIIAIKGKPNETQKLSDMLKSTKGIKHTTLSVTTTGREII